MVDVMTTWSIREVPVTETPEGAWLLHGFTAAMNDVLLDAWGNRDFERTPTEILGSMHDQRYIRKPRLVAVADDEHDAPDPDRVLGYALVNLPLQDNTHTAARRLRCPARPPRGRASVPRSTTPSIALVRDAGRTHVTTSTDQRAEPPEGPGTLAATTGIGRVLADDDGPPLPDGARLRPRAGRALLRVRPPVRRGPRRQAPCGGARRTPVPTTAS